LREVRRPARRGESRTAATAGPKRGRASAPAPSPPAWQFAAVALLATVCYVQTAGYGFVYDDDVQIARNPRIRSFSNLPAAFNENFWAFNGPDSFTNYYRPLQTAAYMLGYHIGGLRPAPFHWINIVLHALASLAVLWLGWELLGCAGAALCGALVFAAHPIHSENVAWIAGITDVGCGLLAFVSLAAYLRFRSAGRLRWLGLSLLGFFLALLFKEMALALPLLAAAFDLLARREGDRFRWNEALLGWAPFAAAVAVYGALRVHALGVFARAVNPIALDPLDRVATTAWFVARYVAKLFFPFPQNAFYVFTPFSRLAAVEAAWPLALVGALGLLARKYLRGERKLLWLALWCLVSLIPVLSFGSVGQNVFTERYLYIPSLGSSLLVAALAFRHLPPRTAAVSVSSLAALFALACLARNPIWRDDRTFYTATLAVSPGAGLVHNNLGILYFEERNLRAAETEFRAALDSDARAFARSPRDRYNSLLGLAAVRSAEGNLDEAWKLADEARALLPEVADAYQTLGMLMGKRGNLAEAGRLLARSLEINPASAAAHVNMGNVRSAQGNLDGAEAEFRRALDLDPRAAGPRISLALVLERTNRRPEALRLVHEALGRDPGNPTARRLLGQWSGR
jgi:tetratricopeptide (TPR) repeat protein